MSKQSLSSCSEKREIDQLTIRKKCRTITDNILTIDGQDFDACDVREALLEVVADYGNACIVDKELVVVLKKLNVLEYEGNLRVGIPARVGPNCEYFLKHISNILDKG